MGMKILVIGASSKNSIGYQVGEHLRHSGNHTPIYASRSGKVGVRCDITDQKQVRLLVTKMQPDVVILGAGVFAKPANLGTIRDWKKSIAHIQAKSIGALAVADAMAGSKKRPRSLITLGGRDISASTSFAPFTVGNGALWALTRFVAKHTSMRAYYIDLPFVYGSAMAKQYSKQTGKNMDSVISLEMVARAIERILKGTARNGARIMLGEKYSS